MQPDFILIAVLLFCALGMLVSCRDSRRFRWYDILTVEEKDALVFVLSEAVTIGISAIEGARALSAVGDALAVSAVEQEQSNK